MGLSPEITCWETTYYYVLTFFNFSTSKNIINFVALKQVEMKSIIDILRTLFVTLVYLVGIVLLLFLGYCFLRALLSIFFRY